MNKRYTFILSVALCFISITGLLISCSEDSDCSMTARPFMVSYIYKYGANKSILLPDTLKSLTVKALETDSILLNKGEFVHTFDSPLRYTKDTTALVLEYSEEVKDNDTIWISHKNTSFFVSIECGYQMRQSIEKVIGYTKHTLDSVSLRNNEANNYGRENIKIIY